MIGGNCLNCVHARPADGAANTPIGEDAPLYCRRYPPTVFLVMIQPRIQGQQPGVNFVTSFPIVQSDARCGEFRTDFI